MNKQEIKREGEENAEAANHKTGGQLHTDFPMSEKDEVKQAEQNTNKQEDKNR